MAVAAFVPCAWTMPRASSVNSCGSLSSAARNSPRPTNVKRTRLPISELIELDAVYFDARCRRHVERAQRQAKLNRRVEIVRVVVKDDVDRGRAEAPGERALQTRVDAHDIDFEVPLLNATAPACGAEKVLAEIEPGIAEHTLTAREVPPPREHMPARPIGRQLPGREHDAPHRRLGAGPGGHLHDVHL